MHDHRMNWALALVVCILFAGCTDRRHLPSGDGGPALVVDGGRSDGAVADSGGGDGGPSSGCACEPIETYPMVSCNIGATRCTGCLGFDDFCDDMAACVSDCRSEFTCVSGVVMLGSFTVVSCLDCVPGSSCPGICDLVCAS